ncbi:GNAT family N-acetyltransferase [Saliphagus infecundisoli]|uniref:GNAT family N-acetyltransferase n=1 Tax=Saliphagus infecundisoli TaxID=1849069 RepID=A0ABD5QHL4_9EURY|nr:GNAT family N-acetyltransferase [Saliphagus infecundisoli]
MYVRDAKNREEVWLLDHIEGMGLDDTAFRSRDYVVAIDEESGEKAGFGRIRVHTEATDDGDDACELTSIGVLSSWRGQGVGAHVVERLLEYAADDGFDAVYALTGEADYLERLGFRRIDRSELPAAVDERLDEKRDRSDPEAVPLRIDPATFRMPERLREAFKDASEQDGEEEGSEETPEDFGIDPDTATYKYDTGR